MPGVLRRPGAPQAAVRLEQPRHLREARTVLAPRALCLLALAACNPTLPAAPPHANVPPARSPSPIDVCWVEYATDTLPGNYGLAGSSDDLHWDVTFSGLLVRHPRGDSPGAGG